MSSESKNPLLSGALTEAGAIADWHSNARRSLAIGADDAAAADPAREPSFWAPGTAARPLDTAAPVKPSKSRAREAEHQAVLAASLAREGNYARAITAFRRSVELNPASAILQHHLGLACLKCNRLAEAASAFARAARLNPSMADAHNNLGVALNGLGLVDQALGAFERAVKLRPRLHMTQFRLAQMYLSRDQRAAAEAAFRAAAKPTAGSLFARVCEACAADAAGDSARAESLLGAVIAEDPDCSLAYLVLGEMLARAGRSSEAAACLERGVSLDPTTISAWHQFAISTKFTAADRALIERIQACLERPGLTVSEQRALHFALGKAYDDIGDYAEAMPHFDSANRIRAATARLDRANLLRQVAGLIAATPPGYLDRRPDLGVADDMPILIVGMPRSGTTLVEQILSSHPDVAPGGELFFWQDRSREGVGAFGADASADVVHRLANNYLAVLRAVSPGAARVTDKMPYNFAFLGVIRQVFPRAAIVHCRRHPLDTCLSIFFTNFEATIDFASERGSLVFFYRQYQRLMAHWRQVLPPERFIEVDYEELVTHPEPVTRRLIAACGLGWSDACLAPHASKRHILTASLWQARQPIYRTSLQRWKRYEPWLGELRALLSGPDVAEGEAGTA